MEPQEEEGLGARARRACREVRQKREDEERALLERQRKTAGPNLLLSGNDALLAEAVDVLAKWVMECARAGVSEAVLKYDFVPAIGARQRHLSTKGCNAIWAEETDAMANVVQDAFRAAHPDVHIEQYMRNSFRLSWPDEPAAPLNKKGL